MLIILERGEILNIWWFCPKREKKTIIKTVVLVGI